MEFIHTSSTNRQTKKIKKSSRNLSLVWKMLEEEEDKMKCIYEKNDMSKTN